ncbi:MAG: hypothetical protein EHM28_07660, partial [Spirochaetaceae bacterium]
MQKRIMLVFLLITSSGGLFAEETVSASGHADGLGFLLEIESAPYYYEPSIDMNCLEIGGTAGVYIMVNPFVFGLTYNLACHYFVSPGPDSVIIDLSSGYRLPMGLKIHAKYFFNQYLNVSAGIGGIVNYSQLLWSSGVINYDSNFMRIDLGFFLDVGISFGLEWYDMQIRSEFYF